MKYTAAVLTVSDRCARGDVSDKSGPALTDFLEAHDFDVVYHCVIPDEKDAIRRELLFSVEEKNCRLIITTGGTGLSIRDVTPEASRSVFDREVPGIPEAMRMSGMQITERACLSRAAAGTRGRSLIINLPGSPRAALENLQAVISSIPHALEILGASGPVDCAR